MLIQVQLETTKNKLKNFYSMQGTGSAAMLEQFFDRLLNPTSDHITLFYKERGKRILEEISILLFDNSIDFNQRIKIINEFFASDGLAQCIDNCYLLILDVNQKLKSLKRANQHIYYLIPNYATDLASDVATSRPFGSPKTYVEIACELANIPIFSHEIHARNFFLLYAKDNNFPVNVLPDVIAENLRSRLLDLQHTYLQDFKKKFTINGILDYLSETYYLEIAEIIKDSQKTYLEKQNLVQKN